MVEPAFDGIVSQIESKYTREKSTQKGDWVLGQFSENGGEFVEEHSESPYGVGVSDRFLWDFSASMQLRWSQTGAIATIS
ncbi:MULTISPECIES: hypothetical protein [Oscillatoriales]|uniref:hypothetical protein n=1 Tax=Oscillatoriophycideae TaxID=1301283 RepID=UPI0018EFC3D6|nr:MULTISPECIES: hypothetical protein [Oscillatoriales]